MIATPLRLLITGTDTGVGKTHVTSLLARGLRLVGRRVWLHKVVATGVSESDEGDLAVLQALCDDGQAPGTVCPLHYTEPVSPHLAARMVGHELTMDDLLANLTAVTGDHDLLVEGVGGILVPLTHDLRTVRDYARATGLSVIVVTRPHLGTLNHTALTVAALRAAGIEPIGQVLNHHDAVDPCLAVRTAHAELKAITCLPVLANLRHGQSDDETARALTENLLVHLLSRRAPATS